MPAPTYPSVDGASLPSLGSVSLVINKPAGTVSGDWLICFITISANVTITPPGAWTTDLSAAGVKLYKLQAGGSEPSSYTFTRGTTTNTIMGTIVRVSGAASITALAAQSGGTGTSIVIPAGTPPTGEPYLVQMAHTHVNTTFTPPGTATEDFDQTFASQTFTAAVGHEIVATGVTTGTRTWTAGTTGQRCGAMYTVKAKDGDVTAVTATVTSAALAPTVTATQSPTVAAVAATATAASVAPTVTATQSATVAAVAATSTASGVAPVVSAVMNATVAAVLATATTLALPPVVSGSQDSTVAAATATATSTARAPTVTATANPTVAAVTAATTAQAFAPTVTATQNATIAAVKATATSTAIPPVVSVAASPTVNAATATATTLAQAPTVSATRNPTVAALVATATALALPPMVFMETDTPADGHARITSAGIDADINPSNVKAVIS